MLFHLVCMALIVRQPPPPSPFKRGEVNFNYLPWRRGSEIFLKRGGSMVQGHVFLKSREGLALFLFNIFRVHLLEILESTWQSHHQLHDAANIRQCLVHPAVDEDFVICWNTHVDKYSCCQADVWCILQLMMTLLNYLTLSKIVLCVWRKNIFFYHHNFMKKSQSKLSKNELENIP